MQLSNSGRIVILDDTYEEAMPLLEVLGKKSIPYFYFNGSVASLPESTIEGIRFVFLDIELSGMSGQSEKTMASAITAVLKKIISTDNGPYIIIFWSKHNHQTTIDIIIENCTQLSIKPLVYLDLEKSQCLSPGKPYDLNFITAKLSEALSAIGAFQLYVEWENLINCSGISFINDLANCFKDDPEWHIKTEFLMYRLFRAFVEHSEEGSDSDKLKAVFHLLNRGYLDKLETMTSEHLTSFFEFFDPFHLKGAFYNSYIAQNPDIVNKYCPNAELNGYNLKTDLSENNKTKALSLVNDVVDGTILGINNIAKLNRALFISDPVLRKDIPGAVFEVTDETMRSKICPSCIKGAIDGTSLCYILMTPECDIAQRKTIMHRIVYGIICSDEGISRKKNGDYLFHVGPIWNNNLVSHILFNFQTMSSVDLDHLDLHNPIFALKRDLIFDLQSKAANHVNRLGNFMLR